VTLFSNLFSRKPKPRGERVSLQEQFGSLRNLPRFFRMVWDCSPPMMVGGIFLRLVKAVLPLAMLWVGKLIIDEVIALTAQADPGMNTLWWLVGIELGLVLLSELVSRGINLVDSLLGDLFSNKSSIDLIHHAATLDLEQYEDPATYDKLERARRETVGRVVLMSQVLSQLQDVITIISLAAALVIFNWWLLLILALAVLPAFLGETYFNERSYSLSRSWTPERRELDYLRYIGASDETAKEIKLFGLAGFLANRFKTTSSRYYVANKRLAVRRAGWGAALSALGTVAYYGAYVIIIMQTVRGGLSIGEMTFLAGSFAQMRGLLQGMMSRFSYITEGALYLNNLFEFFEIKPRVVASVGARPVPDPIQRGFAFENVSFKYPGQDKWAVRNVSFDLKAGEKLALVGENGAGKTTIVKLLARLYDPTEGRILLDGIDLREYDPASLRATTGIIFQDYVKFQMKAFENIAIGQIDHVLERGRIETSATKSLAEPVIRRLPERYEQMLGKRFTGGVELSGGEWQKVALARAYMRDAQLLILDEPTSSLDARAEHEVFLRFSELIAGKMAVLISHRFSTVRMADRIVFLENGEVMEAGSHEELLDQRGLYAELFSLQARGYR
jgi:ATP-binding cassette subfamily B protein